MNHEKFGDFLQTNKISARSFAAMAGMFYLSKSSVHCLTKPDCKLTPKYLERIIPVVIETCAGYLRGIGLDETEINQKLLEIFEKEYQPVTTKRQTLDYEIREFFGFERDPFALESDPRSAAEAFTTKELDRLARRVEDAVNYQGFLAVLGSIGEGKSTLKNRIVAGFKKQGRAHLIFPTFAEMQKVSAGGIVHYLLHHFGQKPKKLLVMAQNQLVQHLEHLSEQGIRVALCFDECHRLHDSTLTALKNFYELGTGGYERYLGLVLFGQPQFKNKLDAAEFREIAERLEVVDMPSLSRYVGDYIAHRLQLVGGDINQVFEKRAIEEIAKQVSTPLAIGNLANKALIEAYKKGESKVLARFIEDDKEPKTRRISAVR